MPAPAQILSHGQLPVLTAERMRYPLKGLDEGTLEYVVSKRGTFKRGGEAPDFKGLIIREVEESPDAGDIKATLRVAGLLGESTRTIAKRWNKRAFGWDECTVTVIRRASASNPSYGAALAGHDNMRFMESGEDDPLDDYWNQVQLTYRGIFATGLVAVKQGTQSNIMSVSNFTWPSPGPGWSNVNGSIRQQRPTVSLSWKSATAPVTADVGTAQTPSTAPTVATFPTLYGDAVRLNYPDGWVLTSAEPEELYEGAGLWLHNETYEYVYEESM